MSTSPLPTVEQLSAARLAHWHQSATAEAEPAATALLTQDAARHFVSACGLLLFTPRPQHISSPAPSFVEATLGVSNAAPSLEQMGQARALLAPLVADGSVVPLNLLGAPSATPDTPDFVASAAAFSYVFTLRGDKAFRQLPSTSGTTKVSPLALNTYNLLLENGPATASNLASTLGKEVTEAAVLRALNELWQQLRVLPVFDQAGETTVWETTTSRFTKQLKAGANAGQPSALSALISLYLSQALLATETEIETFLSPLAPRSRIRDVIHALSGARQLDTIAIEGKTQLYVAGDLPSFAAEPVSERSRSGEGAETGEVPLEVEEDGSRIKKFVPKPKKVGTGYLERAKPFREGTRGTGAPERRSPQRPAFRGRDGGPGNAFQRPWDEDKKRRPERPERAGEHQPGARQESSEDTRSSSPRGPRPPFGDRPAKRDFGRGARSNDNRGDFSSRPRPGGDRPKFGSDRPKFGGGDRPAFGRREQGGAERPGGGGVRPPARRPFDRPADGARAAFGGERERPAFGGGRERRPFGGGAVGSDRGPRRDFQAAGETGRPRRDGSGPRRPFGASVEGEAGAAGRPPRPPFRKFDAPRGPRKPFAGREGGPAAGDREGAPQQGGFVRGRSAGFSVPAKSRPFQKRDGADAGRPEGRSSFPGRPAGAKPAKFAGKRPFGGKPPARRGADAPGASTFDKFKGGNKPWGNRPPGRKPKPDEGES